MPKTPPMDESQQTTDLRTARDLNSSPRRLAPRIKVCGVRTEVDLEVLAAAGVDSVGINLVAASPRVVSIERACELSAEAERLGLRRIAVVRNASVDELRRVVESRAFDLIQLHGDELPDVAVHCGGLPIIKAIAWSGRDEETEMARAWQQFAVHQTGVAAAGETSQLCAFLVDAYAPEIGGGSGRVARWDLIEPRPIVLEGLPLILAGGLTEANVASAIAATKPDGVDTASGVETRPGEKNAARVHAFASNARTAFGDGS